jgi:hypothetical protein
MTVTPTRVASPLGHSNTDDVSYPGSPSYSLGSVVRRQVSSAESPSCSIPPFENSPSYVRQPLERRLTPLNFIQTPPEPAVTATRTAFPEELPPRPRRYSRCRDRFRTTVQRQEALLDQERRRQAEYSTSIYPYLMSRAPRMSQARRTTFCAHIRSLNMCGYIFIAIIQLSLWSCIAAASYISALQKSSKKSEGNAVGSKLLFWLLSSILLLVISLIASTVLCLCGKLNSNCGSGGFRSRLGLNEIIDDAERGPPDQPQSFEMISGRRISHSHHYLNSANTGISRPAPPNNSNEFEQVRLYVRNHEDAADDTIRFRYYHHDIILPRPALEIDVPAQNPPDLQIMQQPETAIAALVTESATSSARLDQRVVSPTTTAFRADTPWPLPVLHRPDVPVVQQSETARAAPMTESATSSARSERYRDRTLDLLNGVVDPEVITAPTFSSV